METINIKNCVGYLWYSDKAKPEIYNNRELTLDLSDTSTSFIVEGYLYDKDNKKSHSIRYLDGQYFTKEFDTNKSSGDIIVYKGHKELQDTENYYHPRFEQRWVEIEDPNCENMPASKPGALVFIGF